MVIVSLPLAGGDAARRERARVSERRGRGERGGPHSEGIAGSEQGELRGGRGERATDDQTTRRELNSIDRFSPQR